MSEISPELVLVDPELARRVRDTATALVPASRAGPRKPSQRTPPAEPPVVPPGPVSAFGQEDVDRRLEALVRRLDSATAILNRFGATMRPRVSDRERAAVVADGALLDAPAQPAERHDIEPASPSVTHADYALLGWIPGLTITAAIGIAVCTFGNALSRSTQSSSQSFFWAGLLIILVPITFRLASKSPGRGERVSLVVLLGLSLYFVKVVLDPFGFTFADELVHVTNANSIVRTHELFAPNSILPVTSYYPGLETVTAALASTTGVSSFGAGLIVIGAARLVIMLALFLLYERLTGSSRLAGLGAAIYTANANFLFWGAQFSYESLALPLLTVVLLGVTMIRFDENRFGWSWVIVLVTFAVVATHHMSSYALVAALCALCGADLIVTRSRLAIVAESHLSRAPWFFALFALLATLAWLTFVASTTVGYLTPVFSDALVSTIHTVTGEAAPRQLFGSSSGSEAPLLERAVGLGSVAVMLLAFPFGLRALWRRHRGDPLALVLGVAATAFFGTLALRFAPAAWEVGNRASEFLFLGLAFVLALTGLERWSPARVPWLGPALVAASLAVVFAGGVIAGWKPSLRLAHPYRISTSSGAVDSEGRQLARWAGATLGPSARYAASDSDARLLTSYGRGYAIAGRSPDIVSPLQATTLVADQLSVLRKHRLRYVVIDRRLRSFDAMDGYYFGLRPGAGVPDRTFPPEVADKFNQLHADRLYDSGNIVVYDIGRGR